MSTLGPGPPSDSRLGLSAPPGYVLSFRQNKHEDEEHWWVPAEGPLPPARPHSPQPRMGHSMTTALILSEFTIVSCTTMTTQRVVEGKAHASAVPRDTGGLLSQRQEHGKAQGRDTVRAECDVRQGLVLIETTDTQGDEGSPAWEGELRPRGEVFSPFFISRKGGWL